MLIFKKNSEIAKCNTRLVHGLRIWPFIADENLSVVTWGGGRLYSQVKEARSINALHTRVYIFIRQLSSFRASTLWFILVIFTTLS